MPRPRIYSKYHVRTDAQGKADRSYIDMKTGKQVQADSVLEKQFYLENIEPTFQSGEIIDYEAQKRYQLQPSFKHNGVTIRAIDYVCDFWVRYADGHEEIYDVKGGLVDTVALLKRKLMYYKYPDLQYTWVTRTRDGWIDFDEWQSNKRKNKKKEGIKG